MKPHEEDRKQEYQLQLLESQVARPGMPARYHRKCAWRASRAVSDYLIPVPGYARRQGYVLEPVAWDEESYAPEPTPEHPWPDPWEAARRICTATEYRLLVGMYFRDATLTAVAARLGMHKGTASKLHKRALAKLRRYLTQEASRV